jgi:hypothetical protein
MMTIAAARALTNSDVCFVGIGAPSAACNVARLTHAPDITLIYESGTIGTKRRAYPHAHRPLRRLARPPCAPTISAPHPAEGADGAQSGVDWEASTT